ncbi:aspartate kinase [Christensenella sp. NSJ-35]|jgi:aspartate kinase|uniref:Aspartokinase n=2 Tax=Christensenella tenuis TaxID=2763033 RepID=A0ABR7EFI1_9FIRM|nr:aspartate kinase [Christensenella tenuis]MBC5648521.1 aspartate kinase [Christensenella tenuis]
MNMAVKVTKFGGSSLASAEQILKMKQIVEADEARKFVVPSAPGKRFKDDVKVTDLLYSLHDAAAHFEETDEIYNQIVRRYTDIRDALGLSIKIEEHLEKMYRDIKTGANEDYAASRGEYLNGLLIADLLGYDFVDAADVIFFDETGSYDAKKTLSILPGALKLHERAVIPGFYGSLPNGKIKTFSRGGSDITGSIVSRAANADLYENWTDVSGFMMADPRIVENPKKIDVVTYRELRELAYMGATVLHEDSIFPVLEAAIPINVKNTNDPENSGTMIIPAIEGRDGAKDGITGIAGKKNFTVITIEKDGMNTEIGFGRKVLTCLEKFGLSFEHMPSSIDTISIVVADIRIRHCIEDLIDEIHSVCQPDSVEVSSNMAIIATVGRGMIRQVGVSAKLFAALAQSHVNVRMIDQGSSEINIIVGVENDDFEKAVKAIYNALV